MATLLAHIKVHPGMEARFEAVAASLHAATHGTETRVRRYEYYRGAAPGSYYSLLAFDDFLGFLEHQTSDHHEGASPELGQLIAEFRLEWLDPVGGASGLGSTDMQDLPADADDLTRAYHDLFAADVQAWWKPLR
jgi:quinol monooxygenase YgiN